MSRAPRLFEESVVFDESGCWLWMGPVNENGYGRVKPHGDVMRIAHRAFYEAFVGPIPKGLTLDHLCSVRACVNPAHLEPVTQAENLQRAVARRTHCRNGHPLTEANITLNRWAGHKTTRRCRLCINEGYHRRKATA